MYSARRDDGDSRSGRFRFAVFTKILSAGLFGLPNSLKFAQRSISVCRIRQNSPSGAFRLAEFVKIHSADVFGVPCPPKFSQRTFSACRIRQNSVSERLRLAVFAKIRSAVDFGLSRLSKFGQRRVARGYCNTPLPRCIAVRPVLTSSMMP